MKDKKRDNRARDGDPSRLGRLNRGSFQTPGNPLTRESGGSFQISVGQPNWEEKEIKPTDYMPKKKLPAERYPRRSHLPPASGGCMERSGQHCLG